HQRLKVGDILVSLTGNVGRIAIVNEDDLLLNQRVGKLVPKEIDPGFLFQSLNLESFITTMVALSQGGAQPNLSNGDIENYILGIPSREDQKKIVQFLTSLDSGNEKLNQQINHTQTWKKGLLQKMFV